ncbi:hypothetical protein GW17_00059071 [Ensete ventricosum]|nr:hypothetical protein GW17_00060144 [Ensete ventricosum]RWV79745.1 hypothetical protein GW17_00059071 [Ensete ventricosum]
MGSRVRLTERSNGQRSSSGREEMGCRSASLAVRCDIVGPITAKQRKKERKQSNGYSVSIYCVSAGSSGTLEHLRALPYASGRGSDDAMGFVGSSLGDSSKESGSSLGTRPEITKEKTRRLAASMLEVTGS